MTNPRIAFLRSHALWLSLAVPLHFALMGISACETDADGDGVSVEDGDCDDSDPGNFPGNTETCDGRDNDCDGLVDEELSGVAEACDGKDNNCDGNIDEGFSDILEVCDGIDNNCNGSVDDGLEGYVFFADIDQDGFGDPNQSAPSCIVGYVLDSTDCDDTNASINPGAYDVLGDAVDADCNGIIDLIDTVARGDGTVGDGNVAPIAYLGRPTGVAADGIGNVYVADTENHRVRKIVLATGIISTIAGTGVAGSGGDGGPATLAGLHSPADVSADTQGNVYIADTLNHRIRRVTSSGVISTVAGIGTAGYNGDNITAVTAQLNSPLSVGLAGSTLYIGDTGNNRVRKVSPGGTITTAAGTGVAGYSGDGAAATAAQLNAPTGITFDAAFNLYIADTNNNRIRRVAITTGNILSIIGNGSAGYSGDGGQATAASLNAPRALVIDGSGNVYVSDAGNHAVRRVAYNSIISTVAGTGLPGYSGDGGAGTLAQLNSPAGVARDESGNFYVADSENLRIRKLDTAGIIQTFAGVGAVYTGDGGPATLASFESLDVLSDANANLYLASGDRIRYINGTTGIISSLVGPAGAAVIGSIDADSLALNPSGDLFLGESVGQRVLRVDAAHTGVTVVAGTGISGYSGDGGAATAAQLSGPRGTATDKAGNVFIADTNNHRIRKVDTAGIITTVAGSSRSGYQGDGGPATLARIYLPQGIEVDNNGNLYIADTGNNRIRRVNTNSIISTVAGSGVYGYAGDGGAATSASLALPTRTAHDAKGNLFIADTKNNRVRKVDSAGIISTVAGNGDVDPDVTGDGGPATGASLIEPGGIGFDADGHLFAAQGLFPAVRRVTP